jgi:modulator of FtsH protease
MFNMNGGMGGGGRSRSLYNPFGETQGWSNPALQGAISLPEKVMGLTCLLMVCAIGGVWLGASGLNTVFESNSLIWFIAMFALVLATQFLASQPVLGMVLFLAFGVVTGIVIAPLLQAIAYDGNQYIVYEALGATAAVTGGVTLYARFTSRDFSRMGGWLFGALIGVVVAMVIGLIVQSTALQILISAAACVVFSLFLLYDVQRVCMTRQGPPGSAIRMAMNVYLDIFNLFLNLLMILLLTQGGGSSRR